MTTEAIQEFKNNLKEARVFEAGNVQNLVNMIKVYRGKYQIYHPHNHPAELFTHPNKALSVWQHNEPPEIVLRGGKLLQSEIDAVNQVITKTVVISDFEKVRFKAIYGYDPIVNYPGIDYDFFEKTPEKIEDKYGLKDKFVLLECGYITWTKNQVKAVEILADVKKSIPNAVLVLAGYDKDPYVEKVKKRAEELDLQIGRDVITTSYLEGDYVIRDLMKLSSIHITPTYEQGGWAVSFQAIAAGLPTVVSNRFVGSNLVREHNLGYVSDFDGFSDAVIDVAKNLEKEKERTKRNRQWLKNNLTWNKFGERYDKIFTELWVDDYGL
jgi:glycosyltransferase involved in cell wall biosynthesis